MHPTNHAKAVRIDCAEFNCPNYCSLRRDDPIPKAGWTCPTCEAHNDELMLDERARREEARYAMKSGPCGAEERF